MLKELDANILESGDIILTHTEFNPKEDKVSILSALIRFFTNNYWNHAKYVVSNNGVLEIHEALDKGIVSKSLEDSLIGRDILIMKIWEGIY